MEKNEIHFTDEEMKIIKLFISKIFKALLLNSDSSSFFMLDILNDCHSKEIYTNYKNHNYDITFKKFVEFLEKENCHKQSNFTEQQLSECMDLLISLYCYCDISIEKLKDLLLDSKDTEQILAKIEACRKDRSNLGIMYDYFYNMYFEEV